MTLRPVPDRPAFDPDEWTTAEFARAIDECEDPAVLDIIIAALHHVSSRWVPQEYQRLPDGDWTVFAFLAGRYTGKTDAGSAYINEHALGPPCDPRVPGGHRMRLVGPTHNDTVASCVNGATGIKAHNPDCELVGSKEGTLVRWPNGAIARVMGAYTPQDAERFRAAGNSSFARGTLIETVDGPRSIETIEPGTLVWTRYGLRPVVARWDHGTKPIWRVQTETKELFVTGDHKVWTEDFGPVRVDRLAIGTRMLGWNGSTTTASSGVNAQTTTSATLDTDSFTGTNGRSSAARSRRAGTSTTRTSTRPTTGSRTWSAFRPETISLSIPCPATYTSQAAASCDPNCNERAVPVATLTRHGIRRHSLAPNGAGVACSSTNDAAEAGRRASAPSAASSSTINASSTVSLAVQHVVRCEPTGHASPVYDLTVHEHHEVIAGGLVAFQCFDWFEELAAWRQLDDCWNQAEFGLRLGPNPRVIVTTSPKNRKRIRELETLGARYAADPSSAQTRFERVALRKASTKDNRFGSDDIRASLYARHGGTKLGRQELEAEIVDDLGLMFAPFWFPIVDEQAWPRRVRYWDLAATEPGAGNEDPDWTAGALVAHDPTRRTWNLPDGTNIFAGSFQIQNIVRLRGGAGEVEHLILTTARRDGPGTMQVIEQDPGQAGKSQIEHYRKVLQGVAPFRSLSPSGSKIVRAELPAAAAQQGRVSIVAGQWNADFLDEAEQFPSPDVHDDQIDALSGAFAVLEQFGGIARTVRPSGTLTTVTGYR